MEDRAYSDAEASLAGVTPVAMFAGSGVGRTTVRTGWSSVPSHLFEVCDAGFLIGESVEDFDDVHAGSLG